MWSMAEIGERLRTQDNRITIDPMFCVQEEQREIGFDASYTDDTVWIDMECGDFTEVPANTPGAQEFGYKDTWVTVMVAFTEAGCEEYLRLNGHNHRGKTRIYVESFRRCPEMMSIISYLKSLKRQNRQEPDSN